MSIQTDPRLPAILQEIKNASQLPHKWTDSSEIIITDEKLQNLHSKIQNSLSTSSSHLNAAVLTAFKGLVERVSKIPPLSTAETIEKTARVPQTKLDITIKSLSEKYTPIAFANSLADKGMASEALALIDTYILNDDEKLEAYMVLATNGHADAVRAHAKNLSPEDAFRNTLQNALDSLTVLEIPLESEDVPEDTSEQTFSDDDEATDSSPSDRNPILELPSDGEKAIITENLQKPAATPELLNPLLQTPEPLSLEDSLDTLKKPEIEKKATVIESSKPLSSQDRDIDPHLKPSPSSQIDTLSLHTQEHIALAQKGEVEKAITLVNESSLKQFDKFIAYLEIAKNGGLLEIKTTIPRLSPEEQDIFFQILQKSDPADPIMQQLFLTFSQEGLDQEYTLPSPIPKKDKDSAPLTPKEIPSIASSSIKLKTVDMEPILIEPEEQEKGISASSINPSLAMEASPPLDIAESSLSATKEIQTPGDQPPTLTKTNYDLNARQAPSDLTMTKDENSIEAYLVLTKNGLVKEAIILVEKAFSTIEDKLQAYLEIAKNGGLFEIKTQILSLPVQEQYYFIQMIDKEDPTKSNVLLQKLVLDITSITSAPSSIPFKEPSFIMKEYTPEPTLKSSTLAPRQEEEHLTAPQSFDSKSSGQILVDAPDQIDSSETQNGIIPSGENQSKNPGTPYIQTIEKSPPPFTITPFSQSPSSSISEKTSPSIEEKEVIDSDKEDLIPTSADSVQEEIAEEIEEDENDDIISEVENELPAESLSGEDEEEFTDEFEHRLMVHMREGGPSAIASIDILPPAEQLKKFIENENVFKFLMGFLGKTELESAIPYTYETPNNISCEELILTTHSPKKKSKEELAEYKKFLDDFIKKQSILNRIAFNIGLVGYPSAQIPETVCITKTTNPIKKTITLTLLNSQESIHIGSMGIFQITYPIHSSGKTTATLKIANPNPFDDTWVDGSRKSYTVYL